MPSQIIGAFGCSMASEVVGRGAKDAPLAERLGFSAVWLRDVPFNVPSFGDVGQVFNPFVYLGALAVQTTSIALGVASIALNLRFNQADTEETLRQLVDDLLPDFAM